MAPRKKKGGTEVKLDGSEKVGRALARVDAMERELALRSQQRDRAYDERDRMREAMDSFQQAIAKEKEERQAIVADMTRMYKSMQTQLISRIDALEKELAQIKDERDLAVITLEETKKERDRIVQEKERVIVELKRKLDEQALQFSDMMKRTLDSLGDRLVGEEGEAEGSRKHTSADAFTARRNKLLADFNLQSYNL